MTVSLSGSSVAIGHQDVTPIDREIARDADRNAETPMAFSLTLNA
jgi:hypothetical protein